jgi:hypothetical protein
MEIRDQVTLDQTYRPWSGFNEVEQGALLVELAASLRRRMATMEVTQDVAMAYRAYAHAARNAGDALLQKQGVPFVPTPPFAWSKLRLEDLNARLPEIRDWASTAVVTEEQSLGVRHTALDLSEAGRNLEQQLERDRTR